jgi:hypothetical protein
MFDTNPAVPWPESAEPFFQLAFVLVQLLDDRHTLIQGSPCWSGDVQDDQPGAAVSGERARQPKGVVRTGRKVRGVQDGLDREHSVLLK